MTTLRRWGGTDIFDFRFSIFDSRAGRVPRRSLVLCLAALLLIVPLAGCPDSGGGMSIGSPSHSEEDAWAIRCISLSGQSRFTQVNAFAEALRKVGGLKADLVQVFDEDGVSTLYYGRYARRFDERGGESYKPDPLKELEYVRTLSLTIDGRGVWPFVHATLAALPSSSAIAQWELTRAKGYYSLQIAVFYNTADMPSRKQAAEAYCKALRDQGEEAYFHHGDLNSCVFIGAFPKDAIQAFRRENAMTGVTEFYEKIVDERLLALQRKYPHNTHNGAIFHEVRNDPRTGQKTREPHTSFAVRIPQRTRSTFTQ